MKTLKANNLSQATATLKSIDEALIEKLNKEVKFGDRKHYHVILVKIKERVGQVKNDVSIIVQKYTPRSFAKVKKQVAFLGFAQAIILHDPTQLKEEELIGLTSHEQTQTIEQVKKELEAKHKKEMDDLKKEINEGKVKAKNTPIDEGTDEGKKFDVKKANGSELKTFAIENEITIDEKAQVKDIRSVVSEWITNNPEPQIVTE